MNEELLERLLTVGSADDAQVIVAEYDIELSDEDAAKLLSEIDEIRGTEGALSDEALLEVTGGISFSGLFGKAKSFFNENKDSIIGAVTGAVGGWMGGKK